MVSNKQSMQKGFIQVENISWFTASTVVLPNLFKITQGQGSLLFTFTYCQYKCNPIYWAYKEIRNLINSVEQRPPESIFHQLFFSPFGNVITWKQTWDTQFLSLLMLALFYFLRMGISRVRVQMKIIIQFAITLSSTES